MNITYKFNTTPVAVKENREKILTLQNAMLAAIADGVAEDSLGDCKLTHTFTEGVYARTMVIPKGTVIVGKIHKHPHLNFIMRGKVSVMTPDGGTETLTGPHMFVSTPGTKRAVYALEETEWTTVHITDETDLAKIEDHVIAPSFDAYDRLTHSGSQRLELNISGEP